MDKNRNCSSCNTKLDKDIYKKVGTFCKSCYKEKKEKMLRKPPLETKEVSHTNNKRMIMLILLIQPS